MTPFLLLLLLPLVRADGRKITVSGRLGCFNTAGQWIPMPEAEVFLFEDDTLDPHDLMSHTVSDAEGRFSLSGKEYEIWSTPKFFIGIYAYCNGDKHGQWSGGPCVDSKFEKRCGIYRKFWATHNFEHGYRLETSKEIRDHYDLDCSLGFKLEDGRTFHGLSCGGSKCDSGWKEHPDGAPKDRCGYEMRMTHSMPPGVPDNVWKD